MADAEVKAREEAEFQRAVLVAKSVKAAMKNPASFTLESAVLTDARAVCLTYRATNSFNAVVPGYAIGTPDDKLRAGSGSDLAAAWNKHCASKPGRDITYVRQALR